MSTTSLVDQSTRSRASWPVIRTVTNDALGEMLARINTLQAMDLDPSIHDDASIGAANLAWEIGDFIASVALPRPDIFASNGEISFEWQSHRIGERVQGLAVLSADGSQVELCITADGGSEPLFVDERPASGGIRTFLLRLQAEVSSRK